MGGEKAPLPRVTRTQNYPAQDRVKGVLILSWLFGITDDCLKDGEPAALTFVCGRIGTSYSQFSFK